MLQRFHFPLPNFGVRPTHSLRSGWARGSQLRRRSRTVSPGEHLEPRTLLAAADPILSEFQAVNAATIADRDGDFSDWIEVRNPGTEAINLDGWYLTDDRTDLRKWRFPAVALGPAEELLVFASNKDRRDPAGELHTNFRLTGDGEFLALVKPDGVTVAQEYSPAYPAQTEDRSYGFAFERNSVELVGRSAAVKAIVPSSDALGSQWVQASFDDSAWPLTGTMGVGFERTSDPVIQREEFGGPLGAGWTVDIPAGSTGTATIADGALKFEVPANHNTGDTRGLAPMIQHAIPAGATDWEVIASVQRVVNRGYSGIAIFDAATGKSVLQHEYAERRSFTTHVNGVQVATRQSLSRDTFLLRVVRDGGEESWTTYFKNTEADEWIQLAKILDDGPNVPIASQPRVAIYARTAATGLQADFAYVEVNNLGKPVVYGPHTGLDVGSAMLGGNSSIYMRVPFTVDGDPLRFDEMFLQAQFDDGFRAFVNGTEITAQNVPIDATWNSSASSTQGSVRGEIPEHRINISAAIPSLRTGTNIVAIHGMNAAVDDTDFFMSTEIEAADFVSTTLRHFASPTPGEPNLQPAAPQPRIVGVGGAFFGSKTIELVLDQTSPGFEIHYTLNGTQPQLTSPKYEGPITLTDTAMFQAVTFDVSAEAKFEPSSPATGTFIRLADELNAVTSDVPLVILDTLRQGIPASTSNTLRGVDVAFFDVNRSTGRASFDNAYVDYLGRGGIRDRGSSTAGQAKPNLAFETWGTSGTTDDDDAAVSLVGLAPANNWVLHAPFEFDRALVRNQFAFDLSNQMGRWAPRTRVVEVYLNRRDGIVGPEDYAGVYVLIERIEPDPGRLDIAQLDSNDNAEPEVSGGYIWKFDRTDPDAPAFTAGGQSLNWVYPKSPASRTARPDQKATTAQQQWVTDYLAAFNRTLSRPNINDPEGYRKYIDVDSWIDNHILNVFMDNVDAFVLSAYLFKDRDKPLEMGPLWDFDRSMESTDDRDNDPERWGGSGNSDFFARVWWGRLFTDRGFWQEYVDHWARWRQTVFSHENIDATLDRMADEVAESQVRNVARWAATRSGFGDWQGEIEHLRDWLHRRAAFFDANFAPQPLIVTNGQVLPKSNVGSIVPRGQEVEITVPPIESFVDTAIVSGEPGATTASYVVPVDNDLGTRWTTADFDDSSWSSGPMGFGFGTTSGFGSLIRTEITPATVDPEATNFLTRIRFQVENPTDIQDLVLKIKYDDGFEAFLNGTRVAIRNLTGTPSWNSRGATRPNRDAITYQEFTLSNFVDQLRAGTNVLAIRTVNASATSTDMLLAVELVSRDTVLTPATTGEIYYTTNGSDPRGGDGNPSPSAKRLAAGEKLSIAGNTQVIARNFDDSDRGTESRLVRTDWSAPVTHNFLVETWPFTITEVNYNPSTPTAEEVAALSGVSNEDFEFIEIHNPTASAANWIGVRLVDGVDFDFQRSSAPAMAPGGYGVVVRNKAAFELRYGSGLPVLGEFTGALDNNGERIELQDGTGASIFSFAYRDADPWPVRADGTGGTLELIDSGNSAGHEEKHYRWRGSVEFGGSPGSRGHAPRGIVINEVLANTRAGESFDSIELLNVTADPINISGWYLSDSIDDPLKYRIPDGTILAAGQHRVFDERQFNSGAPGGFALSGADGDDVWLVVANATGAVTSFVDDVHFGATLSREPLGRIPNGAGRLAPMIRESLGSTNPGPRVGPLVISELQYHPAPPSDAARAIYPPLSADDLEFIEIHNPTTEGVDLANWRVRGGVSFNFTQFVVRPGETLVLVSFDVDDPRNAARVAAFRTHYQIGEQSQTVGGYGGRLRDTDDRIVLQRPDVAPPDRPNFLPRVLEDEVLYDDLAPWPGAVNGTGRSLQRQQVSMYGNDAASWQAAVATPGRVQFGGVTRGDFDADGVVNAADINLLFAQLRSPNPNVDFDLTGDRILNASDRDELVHGILRTRYGDTDLDRVFSTSDLTKLFQAGEYEDNIPGNSTWEDGDWDGDGDVTTRDLVLAFQDGDLADALFPARQPNRPTTFAAAFADSFADSGGKDRKLSQNPNRHVHSLKRAAGS